MSKKFLFFGLALLLPAIVLIPLLSAHRSDDSTPPESRSALPDPRIEKFIAEYDSILHNEMDSTKTPGAAVVILKDTSVIYMKGLGLKTVGTHDSVDIHTIFRLGSVSKGISALLSGILVQDSVFSWNDKVRKYIPDFTLKTEQQSDSVAIRHLLSHTTGLPYHTYTNAIENGWTLAQIKTRLKNVDLIAPPGKIYSYQNAVFSLIADVIDSATGQTFDSQMTNRLFKPLRMNDASVTRKGILNNPDHATPHVYGDTTWYPRSISAKYYNAAPAGGVNASISDMAALLQALLGNCPDVVHQATLDSIFRPYVHVPLKRHYFRVWPGIKKAWYGMGWRILEFTQDTIVYHGGYVNSYRSEVALDRKNRWAIAILTNAAGGFINNVVPVFVQTWDKYFKPENPAIAQSNQ